MTDYYSFSCDVSHGPHINVGDNVSIGMRMIPRSGWLWPRLVAIEAVLDAFARADRELRKKRSQGERGD